MPPDQLKALSRRERQIIEALYKLELASVQQVLDSIEEPPSYSSVRALLNRMVEKELITYKREGNRYLYSPIADKQQAAESAMKKWVNTFFKGSAMDAVTALLGSQKGELTEQELQLLQDKIDTIKNNNTK